MQNVRIALQLAPYINQFLEYKYNYKRVQSDTTTKQLKAFCNGLTLRKENLNSIFIYENVFLTIVTTTKELRFKD